MAVNIKLKTKIFVKVVGALCRTKSSDKLLPDKKSIMLQVKINEIPTKIST